MHCTIHGCNYVSTQQGAYCPECHRTGLAYQRAVEGKPTLVTNPQEPTLGSNPQYGLIAKEASKDHQWPS